MSTPVQTKAVQLRALHTQPGPLVLPNVWDAASAALVQSAGATAVATTSAGISWSLGRADGHGLSLDEMAAAVRRIASVVAVPVTADIEGGYGAAPAAVAKSVATVVAAGAAGINLEDSTGADEPLYGIDAQRERIVAARQAAVEAGVPDLFINARTDVFLAGVGDAGKRTGLVRERAEAYAAAGADLLFVPGLLDLAVIESVVADSPLGINIMALPGGPSVKELQAVGVRRVSVGMAIAQAAYDLVRRSATELLNEGTYTSFASGVDFGEINSLVSP
ncbi:isocitrate lyase/phosphoenolpyruvate mutase family protein [Streptomyces sp. NPDC051219]|uniref:isocitrate lyase/PEP mutase family protein n=1 Tax=Streptomyces sp. NPDC051219 TaxID=3155283 RepID=UPI003447EADF